jgi:hypothetical protein
MGEQRGPKQWNGLTNEKTHLSYIANTVTCLVEYQNYRTVVHKEPEKGVSAESNTKPVAAVTNLQQHFKEGQSVISLEST